MYCFFKVYPEEDHHINIPTHTRVMFSYTSLLTALPVLLKIAEATNSITISVPEGDLLTFVYPTTVVTELDGSTTILATFQDDSFVSSVVEFDMELFNFIQTETDPNGSFTRNVFTEASSFVDAANALYWMIEDHGASASLLDQVSATSDAPKQFNSTYIYPFNTLKATSQFTSNNTLTYTGTASSHTIAAEGTTISKSSGVSSSKSEQLTSTTAESKSDVSTSKSTKTASNTTTGHGSSSGAANVSFGSSIFAGACVAAFVFFM